MNTSKMYSFFKRNISSSFSLERVLFMENSKNSSRNNFYFFNTVDLKIEVQ